MLLPSLPSPFHKTLTLTLSVPFLSTAITRRLTMSSSSCSPLLQQTQTFAGNPLRSILNPDFESDSSRTSVLPFKKGRPLTRSFESDSDNSSSAKWELAWLSRSQLKQGLFTSEQFVYLGSSGSDEQEILHYWAIDVTQLDGSIGIELDCSGFMDLRTLMVATDWADSESMSQLAIAGHARALLEWHGLTRFCGSCGSSTIPINSGRRKQCTNESCKKRVYPRVDPVVIMLVIDKENDCALLSRQSRYVPRMWSCLAGFIEPGENLEEAVRRETMEETGIEIGQVVYHSSQPWPVGPNSMPCQLMVGFFAYAKSFEIRVDKKELEDAQWHRREDVKKALEFAEYEKAQKNAAAKINQMCNGGKREPYKFSYSDYAVESGQLAPMFIPGPYAIAHHLISTWANEGVTSGIDAPLKKTNSFSNL